jgi:hypothetical protein
LAQTPEATALTRAFQGQQLTLTQAALRDLLRLWTAIVRPDDYDTFERFARLAATLVGMRGRDAAGMAAAYYEAFRRAEGVAGAPTTVLAEPVAEGAVAGTLRGAALVGAVSGRRAGQTPEQAARSAFARASGSATRLILDSGRGTVARSVRADREALGWIRVTDADPCAFCRMVASRGPAFKSAKSAGGGANAKFEGGGEFKFHDHCQCTAEPFYEGSKVPALNEQFDAEYTAAQKWARANPDLAAKGTKNDALNNLRNYLAQHP